MRELISNIREWKKQNKNITLATVVKAYGSAPQPVGSMMSVNDAMQFDGSVSGGCVEGDVIRQSMKVTHSETPKLVKYGISDDTALDFGLACGGEIEVFIEPFTEVHEKMIELLENKEFFATATILSGIHTGKKWLMLSSGDFISGVSTDEFQPIIRPLIHSTLQSKKAQKIQANIAGETVDVFCCVFPPPARLMIVGAVHIAVPLVNLARLFGFDTYVIDARSAFATEERFPNVDHLIHEWPAEALNRLGIDENTFITFLSHDDKMDNPALLIALSSKAPYIGALGSRKTHAKRLQSLLEMGIEPGLLDRIHAPIGLKIGAVGAEQIAFAIMAEIIAVMNGVSS
jgi:xanthine dehydrogenase accessory factor